MTQYEMTENLSEKCSVTMAEAKAALEEGDWNMLTAAQALEVEKLRRLQELDDVASSCGTAQAVAEAPAANAQPAMTEADETAGAQPATIAADEPAAGAQPATTAADERAGAGKQSRSRGNLGGHIRRLAAFGNRNRFVVRRGGSTITELPVTVLALLLLCAFHVCLPLLVIGLFAGCRYSFRGRELGRGHINDALDKAAGAADRIRETVAQA